MILAPGILGPNPGLFIMRIWQGVVEICLRIALTVSKHQLAHNFTCCICARVCVCWLNAALQYVCGGAGWVYGEQLASPGDPG